MCYFFLHIKQLYLSIQQDVVNLQQPQDKVCPVIIGACVLPYWFAFVCIWIGIKSFSSSLSASCLHSLDLHKQYWNRHQLSSLFHANQFPLPLSLLSMHNPIIIQLLVYMSIVYTVISVYSHIIGRTYGWGDRALA